MTAKNKTKEPRFEEIMERKLAWEDYSKEDMTKVYEVCGRIPQIYL